MSKRYILFILMALVIPAIGYSAPLDNFYLRGFGGYNHLSGRNSRHTKWETDAGYLVGGAVGYQISQFARAEIEGAYRSNEIEKFKLTVNNVKHNVPVDGNVHSTSLMANIISDFDFNWPIIPYAGVGVGGYWEKTKSTFVNPLDATLVTFKGNTDAAAYQAIGGVKLFRNEKVDCGVEYRYLDAFASHKGNHSVSLTGRYNF